MRSVYVLLALSLLGWANADEFYTKKSGVINLTHLDFDKKVAIDDKGVWFVEFYAPWCGHCKQIKPEIISLAKRLKGLVNVAAVDASEQSNAPLAKKYGIQGFPTMKVFVGKEEPYTFSGGRTAKAMEKELVAHVKGNVVTTTVKKFKKQVKNKKSVRALLLGPKDEIPAYFKGLSITFNDHVKFYFSKDKKLAKKYDVRLKKEPKLVIFKKGTKEDYEYMGSMKPKALRRYFREKFAPELPDEDAVPIDKATDESCWQRFCVSRGLCAVVITSGDPDRNKQALDQFGEVLTESDDASLFAFLQVDGVKHKDWVKTIFGAEVVEWLDMGDPQLVVVSPKKRRFARFVGSLQANRMSGFVTGVLRGRNPTTTLALAEDAEFPKLPTDTTDCPKPKPKPKPAPKPTPEPEEADSDSDDSDDDDHDEL